MKRLTICIAMLLLSGSLLAADIPTLYTSPAIQGGKAGIEKTVDITGLNMIDLVATGYSWGQAVWGNPILVGGNGSEVKLTDIEPVSFKVGWGQFTINKGPDGNPLKIADHEISHGLFAHADSSIVYRLDGKYKQFKATIGINHTAADLGRVIFQVRDHDLYQQVFVDFAKDMTIPLMRPATRSSKLAICSSQRCKRAGAPGHQPRIGNDWVNLAESKKSRILRAPLAKSKDGNGLAWCRDRKARNLVFSLLVQATQSPDVFKHAKRLPPDANGPQRLSFANTEDKTYQAMLNIIENGRETALNTPRVDMLGAKVTKGKCRELPPISPPASLLMAPVTQKH